MVVNWITLHFKNTHTRYFFFFGWERDPGVKSWLLLQTMNSLHVNCTEQQESHAHLDHWRRGHRHSLSWGAVWIGGGRGGRRFVVSVGGCCRMREGELKAAGLRPLREVLLVLAFFHCKETREARDWALFFFPNKVQMLHTVKYLGYLFWPP